MHSAPPVRISFMPDRAWRFAQLMVACAAGANLAAWLASNAELSPATTALLVLLPAVLGGGLARWAWRPDWAMAGELTRGGAAWQWAPHELPPVAGEPRVLIDLGGWRLLRFGALAPPRRATWLTTSRRQAGGLWPAWCAALYAQRPRSSSPVAVEPP